MTEGFLEQFSSEHYYIGIVDETDPKFYEKGKIYIVVNKITGVDEAFSKILPQAADYVQQLEENLKKAISGSIEPSPITLTASKPDLVN